MRKRAYSIISIGAAGLFCVLATICIQQFSFSKQPEVAEGDSLPLLTAKAYNPESSPKGIRLTMELNTAELKLDEASSFELDVTLSPKVAELFEVADSAVSIDQKTFVAAHQPYHNQTPPEGVHARLLLPPGKRQTYTLEIFLAPKDGKTDPRVGLEYLSNAADLNGNVRVRLARR